MGNLLSCVGDAMILKTALKKAKLPDYEGWREIENEMEEEVDKDNPDLGWREKILHERLER